MENSPIEYLSDLANIDLSGSIKKGSEDETLESIITSLSNYQSTVTTDVQQQMIFVSDFMGQYNAYLQGANTQISKNADVLTTLARN